MANIADSSSFSHFFRSLQIADGTRHHLMMSGENSSAFIKNPRRPFPLFISFSNLSLIPLPPKGNKIPYFTPTPTKWH
jgi:hypothetical protein